MQSGHPSGPANGQPPPIPDHTLLRVIGRGAYGEVWLARNVMGTARAVKIIWRRQFESDRPFEREFSGIQRFEPVSRSSGGLVHVLHVGRNEEAAYFYYVMELADAATDSISAASIPSAAGSGAGNSVYSPRTLRSDLSRLGRLSSADCIRLAIDVISGLAQLHRHGLVHRDVKPGNIIYVHGRAKLADIGLVSSGGEGRTFVGTEGYIPPEGPGSPAADLYALGVALYEASTGYSPDRFPEVPAEWFTTETEREALEFHEIVLKACEGQREHRYATAEAMQAELALLQNGQSVRRARALERRYARLRWSGIIGTTLLAGALGIAMFANYRAEVAAERSLQETTLRRQAQESLGRAENAEQESRQQLYAALLEQGRANVRSGELGQRVKALDAVRRAVSISNSAALRGVALAAHALPDLRFERELPYGSEFTLRFVDPALERIALCRRAGPVEIRALGDQRLLTTLPATTNLNVYYAEWSADGHYLAIKRDNPRAAISDKEVWDVAASRLLMVLKDAPFDAVSFHPTLPRLLVGQTNGAAVWDVEKQTELSRVALVHAPHWLRFSPDGERFAATCGKEDTSVVTIHNVAGGGLITSNSFDTHVASFNWHPSGRWIAVTAYDGGIYRLDAVTGEKRLLGRHKAQATRAEFSPDGDYLISGGWDRELICWNGQTLQRAFTAFLNGYVGRFRADSKAYALETESRLQLYTFEHAGGHREFAEDLGARVIEAAFSSDSRWLAAAGTERLGIWDLQNPGPGILTTNAGATRVAFAENGELFADRTGSGFRWRVSPATNVFSPPALMPLELKLPKDIVSLCPLSNSVVLTSRAGSALVENPRLADDVHIWKKTPAGLNGVSPDGRWLAMFPSFTPYLIIHRLPDLEQVAVLTNASNVRSFKFSPACDELAVSCRSGVEFWNTATWQRARAITNLNNQIYSTDGRTMWLTKEFHDGGLYDARTLELLLPLPVGTYPLAVSPDGRRLAVSVDLRRLQVWDLEEVRMQLSQLGLDWRH